MVSVNKRCQRDGPQMVIFTLTYKHHDCLASPLLSGDESRKFGSRATTTPAKTKTHQLADCHIVLHKSTVQVGGRRKDSSHLISGVLQLFPTVNPSGNEVEPRPATTE